MNKLLLAIIFGVLAPFSTFAGQKALVIVDMQDFFITRFDTQEKFDNPLILKSLFEKQKHMIDVAKKNRFPILIIEFGGVGSTHRELLNHIGKYDRFVIIEKWTDGLFKKTLYNGDLNLARDIAIEELSKWNVTELIIMGANGPHCVVQTIRSALVYGYKVWAFSDGIVDLNAPRFDTPYSYRDRIEDFSDLESAGLVEFRDAESMVN